MNIDGLFPEPFDPDAYDPKYDPENFQQPNDDGSAERWDDFWEGKYDNDDSGI